MGILAHFEDAPTVMSTNEFFLHSGCRDPSHAASSEDKFSPHLSPDMSLDSPFDFAAETQSMAPSVCPGAHSADQRHGQLLLCGT